MVYNVKSAFPYCGSIVGIELTGGMLTVKVIDAICGMRYLMSWAWSLTDI